jgi:hypothetical protein
MAPLPLAAMLSVTSKATGNRWDASLEPMIGEFVALCRHLRRSTLHHHPLNFASLSHSVLVTDPPFGEHLVTLRAVAYRNPVGRQARPENLRLVMTPFCGDRVSQRATALREQRVSARAVN